MLRNRQMVILKKIKILEKLIKIEKKKISIFYYLKNILLKSYFLYLY